MRNSSPYRTEESEDGSTSLERRPSTNEAALLAAAQRVAGETKIASHEQLDAYDNYYFANRHQTFDEKPLPVLRVDLADTRHTSVLISIPRKRGFSRNSTTAAAGGVGSIRPSITGISVGFATPLCGTPGWRQGLALSSRFAQRRRARLAATAADLQACRGFGDRRREALPKREGDGTGLFVKEVEADRSG